MRKIIKLIFVACSVFLMLPVHAIQPEQLELDGVSLDSTLKEIKNKFGSLIRVTEYNPEWTTTGEVEREFVFFDVQVYLVKDDIYSIRCETSKYITKDGLRVGDTSKDIVSIYGKPEIFKHKDNIIYKYQVKETDAYLSFSIKDDQVVAIELWLDGF